jgi:hypothetical protein
MAVLAATIAACGSSSSPQQVVDEATLQGIGSGNLSLALGIDVKGGEGGHVEVKLSGPFQAEDEAELPELDLTASAKGAIDGEKVDFDGGITLLGSGRAYVSYEGTEYEVDPVTYGFVKSTIQQQNSEGKSTEVTACQEAVANLDIGDFLEGAEEEGSVDVGGTTTTKVSGDLDSDGAIDALIELTEDPACSEQLEAAPGELPSTAELEEARGEVQGAIKDAHVDLYVGDDHIVRRLDVKTTIEPRSGSGSQGAESAELEIDLTLTGVNEEQKISAPPNSKPLSALFIKLGVNPIELLGLLEGEGGLGSGGINGLLESLGGAGGTQ